ncbi:hypothetical protein GLAREA_06977 [Glarea lozoyensis ATCC 20868]|uniref:Uncharacterized protein n=1 Tax=Glarea lozoyensis (strain ATCC 20868 / MF5171) TaxID=1116229 RepID=S3D9Z9_GLAL2|nr:uncharacterized protein GLAREA_06977 [Glarea lozoyensis ATCC 20868]EPE33964.1 hypothetical protein GLAREA_06977 [Glarea lozoyensis ATCC 20868]
MAFYNPLNHNRNARDKDRNDFEIKMKDVRTRTAKLEQRITAQLVKIKDWALKRKNFQTTAPGKSDENGKNVVGKEAVGGGFLMGFQGWRFGKGIS